RVCKIPQTFEMLIERLDSPLSQVRDAARAELGDFTLQKFLSVFDENDQEVCVRAGRLMQKIDHDFIDQLRREVEHPIRTKRLRAIRASGAMQLQTHVVDSLLKQLSDEEPSVRRAAVDVLKYVLTPDVITALSKIAQQDKSPRVREDAVRACQQMKLYMSQSMSQSTSNPVAPTTPPPASHL
ncbi:MAG: HEAT repeat domain-containing protein, partial [Planctomycetaceae bacterium]|nr:HEAT repeat domain-containing protein [Planctomycetaceae bacterium]